MKKKFSFKIPGYVAVVSFLLFVSGGANAQNDPQMEAILNEIKSLYTEKLEEAVKKDQARYNKMKSDMEEIDKIKDNQGKKKALENYSKNHKAQYGQMVREAGINPNAVISKLKSRFPDFSFSISDDYSILVERAHSETNADGGTGSLIPERNTPADRYANPADNIQEVGMQLVMNGQKNSFTEGYLTSNGTFARGPMAGEGFELYNSSPDESGSAITVIQEISFTQRKSVNCAVASGGNVELGVRHVKASSTAVIAGYCSSEGHLESNVVLPATGIQSIKLRLDYSLDANGYALGIIGTSFTKANCGIIVKNTETQSFLVNTGLYKMAVAPLFWYASFNDSRKYPVYIDISGLKGKTLFLSGDAYSTSFSGTCCATNSSARTIFTAAKLEIVK